MLPYSSDNALRQGLGLFYAFGVLYMLLGLAIVCEEYFVSSLAMLAKRFNLSDDVAGATPQTLAVAHIRSSTAHLYFV